MEELNLELKKMNVYWVTPNEAHLLAKGEIDKIFDLLKGISNKNPNDNFNMMPKVINVHLSSGEVCEGIANANFKKGNIEVMGIFLYDQTKLKYEELYNVLRRHLNPQVLN